MDNYGETIAKGTKSILWSYATYGSYQGDYIAIVEKDNILHIYKGMYGSCSGCDWLEGKNEIPTDDEIKEFIKDEVELFISIPKDSLPETVEELKTLFPANTRIWWNDPSYDFKLEDVLNQLKHPHFKNLEYLEQKFEELNGNNK